MRRMSRKTGWIERAGALLADGGPWGSRGGGGGDSGGSGGGGGPRNPWNKPPGGGRPRKPRGPSAMDEFMARMRDQMSGGGPEGGIRWPLVRRVGAGILILWILFTSFHRIAPQERGVVTTFGAYSSTLESGVGLTLPWPIQSVEKLNVAEIRRIEIPASSSTENFILTGDQNIVDLDYQVRWSISDPELFSFQLAHQGDDPDATIRDVAESSMRAAVSRVPLTGVIGGQRGQIETDVAQRMRAVLTAYRSGVRVDGVAIKRADPPTQVIDAFRDVTAAQQDAQSYVNQANTYAQQVLQRAQGEAASFDKVYEQYRLAPGVTRRRMYYETMEAVLSKVDKTIIEAGGVTPYLPLSEVRRRLPNPPAAAVSGGPQ
jgi:membrane protease subunit HflK